MHDVRRGTVELCLEVLQHLPAGLCQEDIICLAIGYRHTARGVALDASCEPLQTLKGNHAHSGWDDMFV